MPGETTHLAPASVLVLTTASVSRTEPLSAAPRRRVARLRLQRSRFRAALVNYSEHVGTLVDRYSVDAVRARCPGFFPDLNELISHFNLCDWQ